MDKEYYKNKYEEMLTKLNESEKTVKMLYERIESIERFTVSDSEDDDCKEDVDNDEYEFDENDIDFSEEEIKKIKEKMLPFAKLRKSKSEFSSEEEYNKRVDMFNKNKQLLPVYSIEEVEECEKRIGFNLPVSFKNYITKVSREIIYTVHGFHQEINLNDIHHKTVSIYLSGESCSFHNKIYIQGKRKNKVASWCENNNMCEHSRICAKNFKDFVMKTI